MSASHIDLNPIDLQREGLRSQIQLQNSQLSSALEELDDIFDAGTEGSQNVKKFSQLKSEHKQIIKEIIQNEADIQLLINLSKKINSLLTRVNIFKEELLNRNNRRLKIRSVVSLEERKDIEKQRITNRKVLEDKKGFLAEIKHFKDPEQERQAKLLACLTNIEKYCNEGSDANYILALDEYEKILNENLASPEEKDIVFFNENFLTRSSNRYRHKSALSEATNLVYWRIANNNLTKVRANELLIRAADAGFCTPIYFSSMCTPISLDPSDDDSLRSKLKYLKILMKKGVDKTACMKRGTYLPITRNHFERYCEQFIDVRESSMEIVRETADVYRMHAFELFSIYEFVLEDYTYTEIKRSFVNCKDFLASLSPNSDSDFITKNNIVLNTIAILSIYPIIMRENRIIWDRQIASYIDQPSVKTLAESSTVAVVPVSARIDPTTNKLLADNIPEFNRLALAKPALIMDFFIESGFSEKERDNILQLLSPENRNRVNFFRIDQITTYLLMNLLRYLPQDINNLIIKYMDLFELIHEAAQYQAVEIEIKDLKVFADQIINEADSPKSSEMSQILELAKELKSNPSTAAFLSLGIKIKALPEEEKSSPLLWKEKNLKREWLKIYNSLSTEKLAEQEQNTQLSSFSRKLMT